MSGAMHYVDVGRFKGCRVQLEIFRHWSGAYNLRLCLRAKSTRGNQDFVDACRFLDAVERESAIRAESPDLWRVRAVAEQLIHNFKQGKANYETV